WRWRWQTAPLSLNLSAPWAWVALWGFYCGRHVGTRAPPADSLEYFGETAVGNTAFPVALGAAAGVGAGAPPGAAAVASAPHWALRKSRQFCPLRVPADLAAWYLALHSFILSACARFPDLPTIPPPSPPTP